MATWINGVVFNLSDITILDGFTPDNISILDGVTTGVIFIPPGNVAITPPKAYLYLSGSGILPCVNIPHPSNAVLTISGSGVLPRGAHITSTPSAVLTMGGSAVLSSVNIPPTTAVLSFGRNFHINSISIGHYEAPILINIVTVANYYEARLLRDSIIAVGHQSSDISILHNGVTLDFPVIARVGAATIITLNIFDSITLADPNADAEGKKTPWLQNNLTSSDYLSYVHNIAPINIYDIIIFNQDVNEVNAGIIINESDTISFHDSIESGGITQTISVADMLRETATALQVALDMLRIGWDAPLNSHDHYEMEALTPQLYDYVTSHDSALPHASIIETDTAVSTDTALPHAYIENSDSITTDDYNVVGLITTVDDVITFGVEDVFEGSKIIESDTINASDDQTLIFDQAWKAFDIITADSYFSYAGDKDAGVSDSIRFNADTVPYGGEFNYYDNITTTDYAKPNAKIDEADSITIEDKTDSVAVANDTLSATDSIFAIDFQKKITDTLTATDTLYIAGLLYSIYDSITASDSALRDKIIIESDSAALSDSSKRDVSISTEDYLYTDDYSAGVRITTVVEYDSLTVTDTEAWAQNIGRDATDIVTFNPDLKTLSGGEIARDVTDTVMAQDWSYRDAIGNVTDTVTFSDSQDLAIFATDTITAIDSLPISEIKFEKSIKDSITYRDSGAFAGAFEKSYSDTITTNDYAFRNAYMTGDDTLTETETMSMTAIVSDSIYVSDSLQSNFQATVRDTITYRDSVVFGGDVTIDKTDTISIYDSHTKGLVKDIDDHVTFGIESADLIAIVFDTIQITDVLYSDWLRKFTDTVTFRDSAVYGGDTTKIYSDTATFVDRQARDVVASVSDSITLQDPSIRSLVIDDGIAIVDYISYVPTKNFMDSIRVSDSKTFGGEATVACSDTIRCNADNMGIGAIITATDTATLSEEASRIIYATDTIVSQDFWATTLNLLKTVSDSVTAMPDTAIGGGFATITITDTITARDLTRREVFTEQQDILLFSGDSVTKGVFADVSDVVTSDDHVSLQKPYDFWESINLSDSSSYYKVQWNHIYADIFEWKATVSTEIYSDSFEITHPVVTSEQIFSESFEWFPPYRGMDWVLFATTSFEVTSAWLSIYTDTFEYDGVVDWGSSYIEFFEWFSPYRTVTFSQFYTDTLEWKPSIVITAIYQDTFEQIPPSWGDLLYREVDPSNPALWDSTVLYSDNFEVSKSVTTIFVYREDYEMVSPAVWTFFYREDFEVGSPALWKTWRSFSFEYLPAITWGITYNDDFEPPTMLRTSIIVAAAKTKRLATNIFDAHENLIQYSWDTIDPKAFYVIPYNIITIPRNSVVLTTNVHAYGMKVPSLRTKVIASPGQADIVTYTFIGTLGEKQYKLSTRVSASSYLFKWYNTNVSVGNQLFSTLRTTIYAPNKDKVEKWRNNISVGRWKFMLWSANIKTAAGQGLSILHNNLVAKKEVTVKAYKNTNIYVGWLISLAIKPVRFVTILTSYGDTEAIMLTEIAAPFKSTFIKHKVTARAAYPNTKTYRANITTAYVDLSILRTSISLRLGEGITTYKTRIVAAGAQYKYFRTTFSTAYRVTQKPFITTYIGGYADAPFVKEVVYTQKTNIKTVAEYFWQYNPVNNRRKTNILAGADINHPYIHTVGWLSSVRTTKSSTGKLKTNVKADFQWGSIKAGYTNIYALRCAVCIKNNIIASYKTNLSTDIWAAYGIGSFDYTPKSFNTKIWGKRIPQGYFFTNIDASAKTKVSTGFRSNVYVWNGPTYTFKQRIWNTSIVMTKLIIAKPYKTNLNVGKTGYKIQTVANIWSQKGQYYYFRTSVSAPLAMKWTWHSTEISATFTSTVKLHTNMWADSADNQRAIYGRTQGFLTTFSSMREERVLPFRSNIRCIGEILQFVSCGIFEVSPPIRTEIYSAKSLIANIFVTEMPLVAIRSLATMNDSVQTALETFEDFETAKHIFRQYVLGLNENYNMWMGWRWQVVGAYTSNFDDSKLVTWLNFTKIRNDFQYEATGTTQHVVGCSVQPYISNTQISTRIADDSEDFIEFVVWTDASGMEYIDVDLGDGLNSGDYYRYSPVVIIERIAISDSVVSRKH